MSAHVRSFPAARSDRSPRKNAPSVAKTGAVIYCRVSTDDQAVGNNSLPMQRDYCTRFAQSKGLTPVQFFSEAASAKSTKRREFIRMLQYCSDNEHAVSAVIVYTVTRFARVVRDHQNVRAKLQEMGIRLYSASENFDDSPAGRFVETVLSAQGEFDNEQKAEQTIQRMQAAQRAGKWTHRAPVGYVNARVPGNILPHPTYGPIIRQAFEMYAEGASKARVHRHVTALGLKVSPQTFDKILRNPIYSGWLHSSWGITQRGAWEPLISEELYNRVEARDTETRPITHKRNAENEEFPLRRFAKCASCNGGLTGCFAKSKNGTKFPYYYCYRTGCRAAKFPRATLHGHFLEFLQWSSVPADMFPYFKAALERTYSQRNEHLVAARKSHDQRLKEVQARKARVLELMISGSIPEATGKEEFEHCGKLIAELESQANLPAAPSREELQYLLDFAEWLLPNLPSVWNAASYDGKIQFQNVLFPNGVETDYTGIRTQEMGIFSIENDIPMADAGVVMGMASPGGFEPPLPP